MICKKGKSVWKFSIFISLKGFDVCSEMFEDISKNAYPESSNIMQNYSGSDQGTLWHPLVLFAGFVEHGVLLTPR